MLLIVMETCHSDLEGWTTISNYKQLDDSDSDDDSESSDDIVRGGINMRNIKNYFL